MRVVVALALAALLADPANARAGSDRTLSLDEALNLPVPELARRVLGASGVIVLDALRPSWGPCPRPLGSGCAWPWPPKSPPPLDNLYFFGRATSTGSTWLCRAARIEVLFDKSGRVTDLHSEERYGVEGQLSSKLGPYDTAAAERLCASVKNTESYFPSPDLATAERITIITNEISSTAKNGSPVSWNYTCSFQGRYPCEEAAKVAALLQTENIVSANRADCPPDATARTYCDSIEYDFGLATAYVRTVAAIDDRRVVSLMSVKIVYVIASP